MAHRAPCIRALQVIATSLAIGLAMLVAATGAHAADATAPVVTFGQWAESSPYAHYDSTLKENRLYFNPAYSGSATATMVAKDPETGVAHLSWPTPPFGWSPAASNDTSAADLPGLVATYWDNAQGGNYPGSNFTGPNISRIDPDINFSWGAGSPSAAIGISTFSARWTGKITAPENGTYYFQTSSNDGVKVKVNGVEVLSYWTDTSGVQDRTQCAGGISLSAGTKYDIVVEYYENTTNTATVQLRWRLPSQAGAYQTPTGCDTAPPARENYATGMTGGGAAQYPLVPASAFTVGGGAYTRTFSWVAAASGGTVNATANNNDTPTQDTSVNTPIEFVADSTGPVLGGSGTLDIQTPGWGANGNNTLIFPRADLNVSDAGASAASYTTITRTLQRRDGVANGAGGCDTSAGSWTTIGTTTNTGTSIANGIASIPSAGVCSEFRYRLTDLVGNTTDIYASGFRGWDSAVPNVTVTNITEGTNPQYQHVVPPNALFYNGSQSGTFTVTASPTDGESGPFRIQFAGQGGNNWIQPSANVNVYDPGPWETTYSWDSTSNNLGNERITVWDYAGRSNNPITHSITRDVTGPTGGTLNPATTVWRNTLSSPVDMTAVMGDGTGSGVASYQLQREEVTWTAGACPTFSGTGYVNIGSPVLGNPPPAITGVNDTTVQDGKCYRYRVEATDNVSNIGYLAPANTVRVDDTDPQVFLNTVPAFGSGNITLGGTATDTMSGIANVSVRYENMASPGPTTPLYTDTTVAPAWGNYTWNTSALNGTYRLHIDVTDVAGNVVTSAITHDILLDNTAPTLVHSGFTEGTNPEYQHVDPVAANHRAWVRTTGIGAATPSIFVNFVPDDPESGIDFITTPAAPGGGTPWTPATASVVQDPGPYTQEYTWQAGVANFGLRNATATSNSAKVSTNTPFTITADNTAPVGGSITPTVVPGPNWHTQPAIDLAIVNQTDAGADIAVQRVERDEIPRNAFGTCGGATWPNTFSTVIGTPAATLPATITDSSIAHGVCYRYRLTAVDNVGNSRTIPGTYVNVIPDLLPPTATFNTTPTSPYRNTETLAGTASDGVTDGSNSGVANVTLRWLNLDDSTSGTIGTDTSAEPAWAINWNTTTAATPDGNYRVFVDVTDVAGHTVTSIVTRDVIIDNSPPVITFDSFVEGSMPDCQYWSGLPSTTLWFTGAGVGCGASDFTIRVDATDAPGGVAYVRFPSTASTGNVLPDAGAPADDPTGTPYEMHYTYPAGPSNPGNEIVRAVGNSAAFTDLPIALNEDNTAPTGHTITAPGGTASPAWWSNDPDPDVTFNAAAATDGGAGVRTAGHVLERREAPGPGCTVWTAYAPVGATGLASPYPDAGAAQNTCYQYRLASFDNVNNRGYATSGNQVRIDRTLPTGTIAPVPAYVRGTSIALSGTSGDNWSGVASISVRLGAGPATACTPAVAASWTCTWDTTTAPNGPTTLVLVVTDRAGNVLDTQTQPTYVDNEVPTMTLAIAAGANPNAQFVVPGPTPRVYVRTGTSGVDGDFTVTATPTDSFSGVTNVAYPALGTNWTRTPGTGIVNSPGPYVVTYAWTGGGTTANPGPGLVATVADAAVNVGSATFDVVADNAGPTGVTIDYADGPAATPAITFDKGLDTGGSGVKTWRIERRETAVTGPNTCDTANWSGWTTRATDPTGTSWNDGSVVLNTCYQYQLVSVDNVGNATTASDATSDTVTVEPAGIIVVESAASTNVVEGGATDTYTVRLRTKPSSNVTVTLTSDAQVDADAPSLLFTTANWNVAQTVVVSAVQDDVDEVPDPHTGTITNVATSADTDYNLTGAPVVANVTDDDVSGFVVSPSAGSVAVLEAGATSDTYTIRLQSQPASDVVVTLGNTDGEVTFAPATLTFTSANWNADQTVTVTAVDDDYDEVPNAHTGIVTHGVTSADPLYAPLTIADVTAAVTDDDAAGVTVTPTSGLSVEEGNPATDSYTVELDSEPVGTVTITVVDDADVDVSTTTLTFDASDWDSPHPVDVSAFDDVIVEGPHTGTVSHTIASAPNPADAAYTSVAVSPVAVAVLDNDVPGIEVTPSSGLTATEGGAGATYQVRLESEPTSNVTIQFNAGTQLQAIADLVFTPGNWNSYQTVNVAAVQDDVDEVPDPHTGTIVHTVVSGDATYGGWALANQTVAITDDDAVGVTVDDLGGVDVDEANLPATDTFTVVLESEPVGTVTITPTPDAQVTTSGAVTFTAADWSTPKPITVTAIDDDVDETDPHPGAITLDVTGDPLYDPLSPAPVTADVADDDTADVVVSAGVLTLDETAPANDTYTIRLASQPVAPVTVTLAADAQVNVSPATVTFNAGNWSADQTVTVTAVDDPTVEDDPHPGSITQTVTAGDPAYLALAPTTKLASIADNDVPGVTIDELGGVDVTEGTGTDSYTVVLDRQPQADVVVTVVPDSQVLGVPTTLTFTPLNWNVAQPVTVTAVDDAVDEGTGTHPGGFTHTVSSTDPRWSTVTTAAPVAVDVTDNDTAGVTVTASSPYALDEDTPAPGTTVTYAVRLDTEPTGPVTIDLTVPGDLSATPTSLVFDSTDWSVDKTVTVGAIDDAVTEPLVHTRTITHAITTGDVQYGALTVPPVAFDVSDNDIPGILVSETSLAATEGGADDTFTVVLETQPTADVVVDLTGTQVGFDVDPLTFTSTNWATPQPVTVSATNDLVDEHPDTHPGLVELDVTSGDAVYDGWTLADIPVAITDDDTAGVTVTPGATAITVAEAGTTSATYDVQLDTPPTAPVTITPTVGDGQTTVAPASLVFDNTNWNVPKQFTVTAVDDDDDEPNTHTGWVLHTASSADTHYDAALVIDQQRVDIADDDTSGVTVTPVTGLLLDEAAPATTATFTVVLDSRPLGDVDVVVSTPDGQTTAAPTPVTFTPANWNTARTVTVTVVDDDVDENGPHSGAIVVDANSTTDALYDAVDPADVTASIADDDTAGVEIVESGGSTDVDEAGTTDTYQVRLTSKPTADVTVDITGGLDATTTPVQLTFSSANWNAYQTVTVNGTPDFVIEGAHDQVITHATSSSDANYDPTLVVADVIAHVTDDDTAGATITPVSVDVEEGTPGVTDTYDVVLDAEPTQDVTITLTPDAQVGVSTPALVFTPANWNATQQVTVSAIDDLVVEPTTHPGTIQHAMSSADTDFNVPVSDVTAAITDNDVPGVTVSPVNLTVTEGGAGATFDVHLDSMPTADVVVSFTEPGQLQPIASATFTSANWNLDQTITITALNDFVAEGAHSTTIVLDTASSDGYYAPGTLTIPDVDVDIIDDDVASVLVAPSSGLAGAEGGAPVTYDVSLTSQPLAPVTIAIAGDSDGVPTPATLTFDATDWGTPKQVSVAIVDDAIAEGAHSTTNSFDVSSTGDPTYDTAVTVASQVIAITDNDTAGVVFTPALPGPLAIAEGGPAASYTVALTSEPIGNVTIDVAALAGQATASPATLTFTSTNWMTPQPVSVTANDDAVAEAATHTDSLTHTAGGADPTYAALTLGDMDLDIADNDVPAVFIDATLPDTSVAEGGVGDTVRVRLGSQPTADVTVTLSSTQVTLGSTTLTFTSTNWNTPQDVTVDAIDDDVFEGPHAGTIDALTGSVGDPFYVGVAATQHPVSIADDDTAGVIVTQATPNTLDEAAPLVARTYNVRLESEPTQDVDVTVTPDAQVASATTVLHFTSADWNTDQPVAVTPVNDAVAEASPHPGAVAHDTTSTDPAYGAGVLTIDDADFDIADDDTPGITVTPTAPHAVTEGGATSTYTIVLDSQPTADVTIAPVSTQLEWTVPSITFTSANWSTPVPVTLRAIDDSFDEPSPHAGTIVHAVTTSDTGYQPILPADVTADITDNDTSDLVATPVGSPAVDEAGMLPPAQYVLTLTSQPTAAVTVTLGTPAPAQVAFTPATVVLDSTNWNTGVTVDVTAIQDDVDEASPLAATITHVMSGSDANFAGETGPDQAVDVTDDDTAGVLVAPSGASTDVAEDGSATDDYDVRLTSEPTGVVTITMATPGNQVAVTPATLTFDATNWNTNQTVQVTGVQDFVFEGPHTGTITHVASSTDPNYDPTATPIDDVVANVLDDDVPNVVVTPAGGSFEIAEGGSGDQLVVTLTTDPASPVTIDLATPDGESTTTPSQVVLDGTNWNTGVSVDVDAVDDGFIEGLHSADVTFAIDAAASDDAYDAIVVPDATAQVTDNDAAAAIVDLGDGLALDEAAPATTDTFTVKLQASPAVGQTVDITLSELAPGGQLTFAPATLTFDDTNWNAAQTVTVTVVDDDVDEAASHTGTIEFAVVSGDTDFNGLVMADVDATIADDDTAALTITPATIAVAEAGTTTQVVDVQLATKPIGAVEVLVTGDAQVDVVGGPVTLAFDDTNWNVAQQVTVRAVDDQDDEDDPHPGHVTFDVSSPAVADPTYDALPTVDRVADVADDDTSAVVLTQTAGTQVAEANAATTVDYDVDLATRPSGTVTVTLVPDAQLEVVGSTTLTFTTTDWSTPQPVQLRAKQDFVVEGSPHPGLLSLDVGGADPRYDALAPTPTSIDVLDDDVAGVTVTQGVVPAPLDEDGTPNATVTYDVELTSQPIDDVDVTLTPDAQVEVVGGVTTLTFTAADWNVAQQVTVQAVDDLVTELDPHPGVITHASDSAGDLNYASAAALTIADATFDIGDDDQPGFTLAPAAPALTVDEAGATSATYDLSINSIPAGPVTVDFTSSLPADVTVSPASHTFNAGNAATPVTITVTAVDDSLVDPGEQATITHVLNPSSDPAYLLAPPIADATVDVTDDDVANLVVDDLGGVAVAEAGATTDTFEVRLTAEPTQDVTVDFAASTTQLEDLAGSTVTFTSADWMTPQTVTVQAKDDAIVEADPHVVPIAFTTASTDTAFAGLTVTPLDVSIDDDDVPAFVITDPTDMTMDEANAAGTQRTVNIKLATVPASPVTINVVADTQLAPLGLPLVTLDSSNWNTGADVTVEPVNDLVAESDPHPGVLSFNVAPSSDPAYAALPIAARTFQITDNDLTNAAIECMAGSDWNSTGPNRIEMNEDPSASTNEVSCYIQLGTVVPSDVTVDVDVAPASQLSVDQPTVLVPANSSSAIEVKFTATDDLVAEGVHPATISFDVQSADPIYDALTIPTVDVDITDNDTMGVTVTPAGPLALAEGGTTQALDVVLTSQPTGPVTIDLAGGTQLGVNPTTLTFQPTTWNNAQQVTVGAIDDPVDEPDGHPGQVTFSITTTDVSGYATHTITPVDATITDNDTPAVVVTPTDTGNDVTEAGATDQFNVQLGTRPTDDVVVTLTADAQATVTPATLTFTSTNWNQAQAVTVGAAQDQVIEGTHTGNVSFALASNDTAYAPGTAATPGAQAVNITDDDVAGIVVVESDGKTNVAEAGGTDTYTIALTGQPLADVTIGIDGTGQVTTAPASVTFTPADWNTAKAITVTAVQDELDEADTHPGEIRHAATTTAAGWANASLTGVVANITDDDTATIVVNQTENSTKVTEGASRGDTITFALSSKPSADVSIVATGDAQLTVDSKPIVLTPAKWKDPISLQVTAVDDLEVEGTPHPGVLSFAVTSEDTVYKKATVASITADITDNDVDPTVPTDLGEDEEDEDGSTRRPRSNVPPATIKPPTDTKDDGDERRTSEGSSRTDAGSTRTPDGIEGTSASGSSNPDGVRTGRRLGGEVVAAKDEETETKRRSPVAKLTDWLKDNWLLAALIVGGGTIVAGTGAWLMRGDPIKAAQRAAATKTAANAAQKGGRHLHGRPRRVGRKKKKDDDEDSDGSGPNRRAPRTKK